MSHTLTHPRPNLLRHAHDALPAIVAGLIAVLVSYAGPLLLIFQAGQAAKLSTLQITSWIWAISIGSGLCSLVLSWRERMPVICAWNTPGAALLAATLVTLPYAEAIGAYIVAALLMGAVGVSGLFERFMARVPQSLCAALLAGILLRFGLEVFGGAAKATDGGTLALIGAMFATYLAGRRAFPRYAIVATLLVGTALWWVLGCGDAGRTAATTPWVNALHWATPVWTTPAFTWSAALSLGVPLAVLGLTGQQVPGLAVLRSAGYKPRTGLLVNATALVSLLLAPFGAHGVNLAAITAAICTEEHAHPDPQKRWIAGVACGLAYIAIGSVAGVIAVVFLHLPPALASTVAGLALLGAIQGGLTQAMAKPHEREAALITFVVTASNVTLGGLGSACWGLLLGGLAYALLRPRAAS